MKRRTIITFSLSLMFLAFFLFGNTVTGQKWLMGDLPADASYSERADAAMGVGLAPYAWGLLPFLLLFGVAVGLLWSDLSSDRQTGQRN